MFSGLKKYSKYLIRVYGLTRRGKGPARALTVQTDEDGKTAVRKKGSTAQTQVVITFFLFRL